MKKKNEYLPADEEKYKEGKHVEGATESKTEAKSSVISEVMWQKPLTFIIPHWNNKLRVFLYFTRPSVTPFFVGATPLKVKPLHRISGNLVGNISIRKQ